VRWILALEVVVHLLRCLATSVIAHQQIPNQLFKFLEEIALISPSTGTLPAAAEPWKQSVGQKCTSGATGKLKKTLRSEKRAR
jgi:hypothetical protein